MFILLVDHSKREVEWLKEAFSKIQVENEIAVFSNGRDALAFLEEQASQGVPDLPNIILLDLNVPEESGRMFLNKIKVNPRLKRIPVVVLTSSKDREHVRTAYLDYANCYISKPDDQEQFQRVVNAIEEFWFKIVKLPVMR